MHVFFILIYTPCTVIHLLIIITELNQVINHLLLRAILIVTIAIVTLCMPLTCCLTRTVTLFKFKVGPIRKIVFVPRNTESLIYLLWHGEIVMAGPGCGLNI